jgi:uncharacterized protein YegP (UPF0339 family)/Ca2+/Na+ antiporter
LLLPEPSHIVDTIRGNTKPRIVTWLTWALLTGVAGAASLSAGQLGGAVFALLGTVATSAVVVAGLRFGDRSFTRLDLACLAGVLLGLLLWLSLDNPIFAVWAAILIDFVGLVPTLVHAWKQPAAETASAFVCVGVGGLITSSAIASGGSFAVVGLGYPLYAAVSMGSVAAIIVIRRKSMKQERGDRVADLPDDFPREPVSRRPAGDLRRIGIARPNLRRLRPMTSRLLPPQTEAMQQVDPTPSTRPAVVTTSSHRSASSQRASGRGRRAKRHTGRVPPSIRVGRKGAVVRGRHWRRPVRPPGDSLVRRSRYDSGHENMPPRAPTATRRTPGPGVLPRRKPDRAVVVRRRRDAEIRSAGRRQSHSTALRQSSAEHSPTGAPRAAKFVLTKNTSGEFHFNLLASNGRVIATSESYKTRTGAMNGI